MTRSTLRLALLAAAALTAGPALAQSVTITGAHGGTGVINRDCVRAEGQATCSTAGTYTGANGATATRSRERVTVPGQSTTTINRTGAAGNTSSRTRILTVTR